MLTERLTLIMRPVFAFRRSSATVSGRLMLYSSGFSRRVVFWARGWDSVAFIAIRYGLWSVRRSNPSGDEIFYPRQTGRGAHPASCTVQCVPGLFAAIKAAGTCR
jgi:hypothetical protein